VIPFSPKSIVYKDLTKFPYPEFLLHLDTIGQCLDHLVIEVVLSEVDPLQLIVRFHLLEYRTHTIDFLNGIVLKRQLSELWSIFEVFQNLQDHLSIDNFVFN
jgi:hypothetical protein